MAIENPVSMPVEDDVRADLEAAWNETPIEEAPATLAEPEAKGPETPEATAQRARDEQGRFAKQEAAKEAKIEAAPGTAKPAQQPQEGQQQPIQAAPAGPPPGWPVAAKAEFDRLPQPVKDAIVSRETEINKGFAKLTEYKGLDPYVEQARSVGSNLPQILDRYMAAEQLLAENFPQGVLSLCQMYNVHPAALAQILSGQQGNQQPRQSSPLDPVYQQMSALSAELANIRQERETGEQEAVNGQIASFAADPAHKYFENVRQTMGLLLRSGQAQDMEGAYTKACRMDDEIYALQLKEAQMPKQAQQRQAVNQARRASGSIPLGSPIPGAQANGRDEPSSIRDALEQAWSEQGGAI
jgi:hypothetical protein